MEKGTGSGKAQNNNVVGFFSLEAAAALALFESITGLLGFKRKSVEITNIFRLTMLVRIVFHLLGIILKAQLNIFAVFVTAYLYFSAQRLIILQKGKTYDPKRFFAYII